jgi:hypothetical protein
MTMLEFDHYEHQVFFLSEVISGSATDWNQLLMYFERYQLPVARVRMYATVGTKDLGRMLKTNGSRIIST